MEQLDGKTTAKRRLEQLPMNLPRKHPRFGTFRTKDDPIDLKDACPPFPLFHQHTEPHHCTTSSEKRATDSQSAAPRGDPQYE